LHASPIDNQLAACEGAENWMISMNDHDLHTLLDASEDHSKNAFQAVAGLIRERRALIEHISENAGVELTLKLLALIDESILIVKATSDWEERYHREHPDTVRPVEEPYDVPADSD
jgi:hypothetical protein